MEKILASIPEESRKKIRKQEQPEWIQPMLAKLTHDEFSDKDWIFERKLDGVRCLVFKKGKIVRLMSRNQNLLNNTYPELVAAFQKQTRESFIVDGEIVAFRGKHTSFSELQKRMNLKNSEEVKNHQTEVFFYAFDVVHAEDNDLSHVPVIDRKNLLEQLLEFGEVIRFTRHRKEEGLKFLEEACKDKWEGLIAKKANSRYTFGRSSNWLKFKCTNEQELVIGGFTEPTGQRKGFGSLLLGFYEGKELIYAGKVGTGFTDAILEDLYSKLTKLETEKSPFSDPKKIRSKYVHWVKPELVAQVSFTEWTGAKKLRHPSFLGLRNDKAAKEVVLEG